MHFTDLAYTNVQNVSFVGKTFALSQVDRADRGFDIAYTYLKASSGEGETTADGAPGEASEDCWTQPSRLSFPTQVRRIGMSLLTEPVFDPDTGAPSTTAVLASPVGFTPVVDGENLWIFRTGADLRSILADRFRYDKDGGTLVRASEVRFRYSGHPDLPADQHDRYSPTDPIGDDFIEPTFRIVLDATIADQPCAAVLVPNALSSNAACWQIFATNTEEDILRYEIPYSSRAWFDLTGRADSLVGPFEIAQADCIRDDVLGYGWPTVGLYEQQEQAFTAVGEPQLVQRAKRGLLVCQARNRDGSSHSPRLASFDMALGVDGAMPKFAGEASPEPIEDYQTALSLDGRGDHLSLNQRIEVALDEGGKFFSIWVKWNGPNSDRTRQTILSLNIPGVDGASVLSICVDDDGAFSSPQLDLDTRAMSRNQARLKLGQWVNVGISVLPTSDTTLVDVYVSGRKLGYGLTVSNLAGQYGFTIGQTGGDETGTDFFHGFVGQVFVARTYFNTSGLPPQWVYASSPEDLNGLCPLFWRCGEGHGVTLHNATGLNDDLTGNCVGATWVRAICPDQSTMPTRFVDARYLDVRSALIDPVDAHSDAPSLQAGIRPSLMRGADGCVHVYFMQSNFHGGVLHMTTEVQRGRQTLSQHLNIESSEDAHPTDVLALVARQAGLAWGQFTANISGKTGDVFDTVTFSSPSMPNLTETWRSVPCRLDLFAQVINGQAEQTPEAGQPQGASAAAFGVTQYDYICNVEMSDPATGAQLTLDGPTPSAIFSVVAPAHLLAEANIPELDVPGALNWVPTVGGDPGWIMEPLSPSLHLSGRDGASLQTNTAPALDIDGDLTLQCWLSPNDVNSGAILTYNGDKSAYRLSLSDDNQIEARRTNFDASDLTGVGRTSLAAPETETWTHVAAVYKSSFAQRFQPGVYVKCANSAEFDPAEALTVEAWVKLDPDSTGRGAIVSRRSEDPSESSYELSIRNGPADDASVTCDCDDEHQLRTLRFDTYLADGTYHPVEGSFCMPDNTWMHVAGRFTADRTMNFLMLQDDKENFIGIGQPTQELLTTFTVEMKVRLRDAAKQTLVALNRIEAGGPENSLNYFQIAYDHDGDNDDQRLSVVIEDSNIKISRDSWDPQDPEWAHLAVVVETEGDGSCTYVSVYVDGEVAQLDNNAGPALRVAAAKPFSTGSIDQFRNWNIGADWDDDGRGDFPDMDLREFRLWTTPRSQTEILNAMQSALVGSEPGLVRYIVCDSDAGSGVRSVIDQASGKNFKVMAGDDDDEDAVAWDKLEVKGEARVYLNGQKLNKTSLPGPNNTLAQASLPLTMGKRAGTSSDTDPKSLVGAIDDVRIWNTVRTGSQINYFRLNRIPDPEKQTHLVAYWRFDNRRGATAEDFVGGHDGVIKGIEFVQTSDQQSLWEPSVFGADWTIYFNGEPVELGPRDLSPPSNQSMDADGRLHIGSEIEPFNSCIFADLSELQIWSAARTAEAVRTTRFQPLSPVPGLAAYYRFNDGAGARAADLSGGAQDAAILFSDSDADVNTAWVSYDAGQLSVPVPIRDEALYIVNASNGYAYHEAFAQAFTCAPTAVEDFATGQRIYSWCAHANDRTAIVLRQDMPLAATELVYLGQMQYKPQLVGFIEGAPPVPSENLTIDASSNPDRYLNNSSTSITRAENTLLSVSDGSTTGYDSWWQYAAALVLGGGASFFTGTPIAGLVADTQKMSFTFSFKSDVSHESSSTEEDASTVGMTNSYTYAASLDGGWENNCYQIAGPVQNPYAIAGKRLYRPNNMGSAMVKSRTADVYALRSSRTKAMLGLKMSVNPELPEDINIINFKLNPEYTRNGTLDGYVGFDKDEFYRDLPTGKKASYFKPQQAYRLKHTIERENQKIVADGKADVGRSLVNTYVWTADAGSYSEEQSGAASHTETFSGAESASFGIGLGFEAEVDLGFIILSGGSRSLDMMAHLNLNVTYSASTETDHAISISSNVDGEGFLYRVADFPAFSTPLEQADIDQATTDGAIPLDRTNSIYSALYDHGVTLTVMNRVEKGNDGAFQIVDLNVIYDVAPDDQSSGKYAFAYVPTGTANSQYAINYDYAAHPCPGKVRGYRYMSLFLSADTSNFDAFFGGEEIIDPCWLISDDPDAIALRQAKQRPNAVWRLMHRVTYVNRVPPTASDWVSKAEPPKQLDVANAPLRPDDHSIHHNVTLVEQVLNRLGADMVAAQDEAEGDPSVDMLDFHHLDLNNVDMSVVVDELESVLTTLGVADPVVKARYLEDMTAFFELLLAPDERQSA